LTGFETSLLAARLEWPALVIWRRVLLKGKTAHGQLDGKACTATGK
jgi:hypothetical protein